jgi:hypothetical protein
MEPDMDSKLAFGAHECADYTVEPDAPREDLSQVAARIGNQGTPGN